MLTLTNPPVSIKHEAEFLASFIADLREWQLISHQAHFMSTQPAL